MNVWCNENNSYCLSKVPISCEKCLKKYCEITIFVNVRRVDCSIGILEEIGGYAQTEVIEHEVCIDKSATPSGKDKISTVFTLLASVPLEYL